MYDVAGVSDVRLEEVTDAGIVDDIPRYWYVRTC